MTQLRPKPGKKHGSTQQNQQHESNPAPVLLVLPPTFLCIGDLQVGFYGSTCPKAESLIQKLMQQRFRRDASLTAALLRLQFHDCFVRGCDASILIDSTEGSKSEKDADDSFFLRGFGVIDDIKEILEVECPSTVSCADIIVLAVRDVVALAGGPKYKVPTGRRDGLVSNIDDVDIPKPDFSVGFTFEFFDEFGLTLADMITLLGAHTVGRAHCEFFSNRLPRPGNESSDPTMDPTLKAELAKLCFTTTNSEAVAFLDQGTPFTFDNSFYKQLLLRKGILKLDQWLAFDKSTRALVAKYAADNEAFLQGFAEAIVKMGRIRVLTGVDEGEIRKNCRAFNNPK